MRTYKCGKCRQDGHNKLTCSRVKKGKYKVSRQMKWKRRKQEAGLCTQCGVLPLVNNWYCELCRSIESYRKKGS
jgi:hypothetical protein